MDPDANLDEQLLIANGMIADQDSDEPLDSCTVMAGAMRLSELVVALDAWLKGGGHKPRGWVR